MYPTLKEVALAGAPGSKAMKQVAQLILGFAIRAAGEGKVYFGRLASPSVWGCLGFGKIAKHT